VDKISTESDDISLKYGDITMAVLGAILDFQILKIFTFACSAIKKFKRLNFGQTIFIRFTI